jgi:hypothetical protein
VCWLLIPSTEDPDNPKGLLGATYHQLYVDELGSQHRGNVHLRAGLYLPALAAQRFNPSVAALRKRLLARGKSKMTVVVACMRKLLGLAYGVLKTRKPYYPYHTVNVQLSTSVNTISARSSQCGPYLFRGI